MKRKLSLAVSKLSGIPTKEELNELFYDSYESAVNQILRGEVKYYQISPEISYEEATAAYLTSEEKKKINALPHEVKEKRNIEKQNLLRSLRFLEKEEKLRAALEKRVITYTPEEKKQIRRVKLYADIFGKDFETALSEIIWKEFQKEVNKDAKASNI